MPQESLVVAADDEILAAGMDVETAYPARTGLDGFQEFLFGEVVAADAALGRDEEDGFTGVERRGLGKAFEAAEGVLGEVFGEGVDGYGGGLAGGGDGGEVVAATVPGENFYGGAEGCLEVDTLVM